jgi:hypothetical protein
MYFVVRSKMSLGSDLNITVPGQPYAVANPWNSSPVFHFNDAESTRPIRKDAIAMRSYPILTLAPDNPQTIPVSLVIAIAIL